MDEIEINELFRDVPSMELVPLVEALFSLDCLKISDVKDSILELEGQQEEKKVDDYSDEEVFSKYMEFMELNGTPLDLAEYLADRREWEYESQEEMEEDSF